MANQTKFERVSQKVSPELTDLVGRVRVIVHALTANGRVVTGNVSGILHIKEGKVTEVTKLIEKSLFGD
jgi:hypothetical protein